MAEHFLYSTNYLLKLLICQKFRGDVHYVWCSEHFDSRRVSQYSFNALTAASSNPAQIYSRLKEDITSQDKHSDRINAHRASLQRLAIDWEQQGLISSVDKEAIVYRALNGPLEDFRPLIYIIPRHLVSARIETVPPQEVASSGFEFRIRDLRGHEFEVIEI